MACKLRGILRWAQSDGYWTNKMTFKNSIYRLQSKNIELSRIGLEGGSASSLRSQVDEAVNIENKSTENFVPV